MSLRASVVAALVLSPALAGAQVRLSAQLPDEGPPPHAPVDRARPVDAAPLVPRQVLGTLSELDRSMASLGELAKRSGVSRVVRAYGDRVARDRALSGKRVRSLANRLGVPLDGPSQNPRMTAALSGVAQGLADADGPGFDDAFLGQMRGVHQNARAMVEDALRRTENRSLKALLRAELPIIEQDEALARELQGTPRG